MARKKKRFADPDDVKMNLTPMIDMTFLLVVFFMLSIDLTQKEFANLDLPAARLGIEDKDDEEIPRLVINLLSSGDIQLKDQVYKLATGSQAEQKNALEALKGQLQQITAPPELREPDRSSKVPVMIHGDRSARWQYVQWIMMVCADPRVGIYKIQFAVSKPPGEEDEET